MGNPSIIIKKDSGVITIVMNRPEKMNGTDLDMCQEMVSVTEKRGAK